MAGANTYTGLTTVTNGILVISNRTGSSTGNGAVDLNFGGLEGSGTITGPLTIGTGAGSGANLKPGGRLRRNSTLTVENSLTLNGDAIYGFTFSSSRMTQSNVTAGGVMINRAHFILRDRRSTTLASRTVSTAISNAVATPISGTFANLPDGLTLTTGPNTFQVSYRGGDGNDLTLTVVP